MDLEFVFTRILKILSHLRDEKEKWKTALHLPVETYLCDLRQRVTLRLS